MGNLLCSCQPAYNHSRNYENNDDYTHGRTSRPPSSLTTKTEYMKKVPSQASFKPGGPNSSQNNGSTFSGISLFNQFGFQNNSTKKKELKKEKKKAIQQKWEQFRDTSNRFFDEESQSSDSDERLGSQSSKKTGFARKKSLEGRHGQIGLELSDNGNLSKSMSNDQKNGFLEVGLHQKHDVQQDVLKKVKQEHSLDLKQKNKKPMNAMRQQIYQQLCDSSSETDSNDNLSDEYGEEELKKCEIKQDKLKAKKEDKNKKKTEEQIGKERQKVQLIKLWQIQQKGRAFREMDGEQGINQEVPQNILAELQAEIGAMTDHEQAVLANYLSQAELTDGFEYGFQKMYKNNLGSKLAAGISQRARIESLDLNKGQIESDGDSLQLSGAENEIISGLKLRNKLIRDQQTTDNEAMFSVYESATDNDLMAFIGMNKDKRANHVAQRRTSNNRMRISNQNLHKILQKMSSMELDFGDEPISPSKIPDKIKQAIEEDASNSVSDNDDENLFCEPKKTFLDQALIDLDNEDWAQIEELSKKNNKELDLHVILEEEHEKKLSETNIFSALGANQNSDEKKDEQEITREISQIMDNIKEAPALSTVSEQSFFKNSNNVIDLSSIKKWNIPQATKNNSQGVPFKKQAFQDDIVNEEFNVDQRRGSILQQHLKRKEKIADLPKKKKPRKPRANGHLSVMDQIVQLEHQEDDDKSPERRESQGTHESTLRNFNFVLAQGSDKKGGSDKKLGSPIGSQKSPGTVERFKTDVAQVAKKRRQPVKRIESFDINEVNNFSDQDMIRDFDDTNL